MKKFKLNGYYGYYIPEHHLANKSGIVYEHILIAENDILHRPIRKEEVVHHKDENKSNNAVDNLIVFATKADHTAYHRGCKAVKQNDVYICPDKYKAKTCSICGSKKEYTAKFCRRCTDEKRMLRPSKDKLMQILQTTTNKSEIGRIFGVSRTSVKKWIQYYNIEL